MTPSQQAAGLVRKAEEDIHVLTKLCDDAATTDEIWGFHAPQAVEKLLKARLAFQDIVFPFTHRLVQLAELLADNGYVIDERFEPLLDLTPYAAELRYSPSTPAIIDKPLDRRTILVLIADLFRLTRAAINFVRP